MADLDDRDLRGRTRWTGIELTLAEVAHLHKRVLDAEQDVAAHFIASLPRKKPSSRS